MPPQAEPSFVCLPPQPAADNVQSTFDPKDTLTLQHHPPPHTPAPANHISSRSSLGFNVLSPVAEADDEPEGTGASQRWKRVEPIGAERPRSQESTKVAPFILAGPGLSDFGGLSRTHRGSVSGSPRPSSPVSSVVSYSTTLHSVKLKEVLAPVAFAKSPDNSGRGSVSGSLGATSSLGHPSAPLTQTPQYEEPTGYEHLSDDQLYELVRANLSLYTELSTNQIQMDTPAALTQHAPRSPSASGHGGSTASWLASSVHAVTSTAIPGTIEHSRTIKHPRTIGPTRATEPAGNYHHSGHAVPRTPQVQSTQASSGAVGQPNVPTAAAAVHRTTPGRVKPLPYAHAHAHTHTHTHSAAQSHPHVHAPRPGFLPADINWGASATTTFDFSIGKSIWS